MAHDAPLPSQIYPMENQIEKLREEFLLWSGTKLEAENLNDAIEEIDAAQFRLELEIMRRSEQISALARKAYPDEKVVNYQIIIDDE